MSEASVSAPWRALAVTAQTMRQMDDDFVVYHPLSGATHQLDYLAGRILQLLIQTPATTAQLISALDQEFSIDDQQDFADALQTRLSELAAHSLVAQ